AADIDFDARVVHIRRTIAEVDGRIYILEGKAKTSGSLSRVPLLDVAARSLRKHLMVTGRTEGLIFRASRGGPIHRSNWRDRVWIPSVEMAGLSGLTFRNLRLTAIAIWREGGASDQDIQVRARHVHRTTSTDVYGSVTQSQHQ